MDERSEQVLTADEAIVTLASWDFYLSFVRHESVTDEPYVSIRMVSWHDANHDTYKNFAGTTLTDALNAAVTWARWLVGERYAARTTCTPQEVERG